MREQRVETFASLFRPRRLPRCPVAERGNLLIQPRLPVFGGGRPHERLHLRLLLQLLLGVFGDWIDRLPTPLLEQLFKLVSLCVLQDCVGAKPLRDFPLNPRGARLRVHVRFELIARDLEVAQRRVLPVLVHAVAFLDPRQAG